MNPSGHGIERSEMSEGEPFRLPRWGKRKKRENKDIGFIREDKNIHLAVIHNSLFALPKKQIYNKIKLSTFK